MKGRLGALDAFFRTMVARGRAALIGRQSLPPHEFAYGAPVRDAPGLATAVHDFLSLPCLEPKEMRIEVSSGSDIDLDGLRSTIEALSTTKPTLKTLMVDLQRLDRKPGAVERAASLVSALNACQHELSDESRQDELIIFLHFATKRPGALSDEERGELVRLARRHDEPRECDLLESGRAPASFFAGHINIYPFAMDNSTWRRDTKFEPADHLGPILEIRFMGLRGVARYVFAQFEQRTSLRLVHLDGEVL